MRLLTPNLGLPDFTVKTISGPYQAPAPSASDVGVAVKILPSISPVFAELPSFTLAQIDPRTADLIDYTVIVASNSTGIGATWADVYKRQHRYRARA